MAMEQRWRAIRTGVDHRRDYPIATPPLTHEPSTFADVGRKSEDMDMNSAAVHLAGTSVAAHPAVQTISWRVLEKWADEYPGKLMI